MPSYIQLTAAATVLACTVAGAPLASSASTIDWTDPQALHSRPELAFRQWATHHARDYLHDAEKFTERLRVFQQNAEMVRAHNLEHPRVTLALNEFADMTLEEFASARLGLAPELQAEETPNLLGTFRYEDVEIPSSIDWVEKGAVTPVKNQGQCGSCWAFSTTGSIEGVNYLATKQLDILSEQELVDCDHNGDNGCNGGLMNNAFEYIIKNGGLDTEEDYAYWGAFPSFCNRRKEADRHVVAITGYEKVPENDEVALARAAANQPVAVAICVNHALMFYKSGVFDATCCTGLNHGVLLVGYGEEDGTPYWKVKNSWGGAWGDEGYFKLRKDVGGEGQCGIAMMASYPVKDDKTNPTVPTICDAQLFSLYECPSATSCQCSFDLFGLLCLSYDCVPAWAVACDDGDHYCDARTPRCDYASGRCISDDGDLDSPLLARGAASRR